MSPACQIRITHVVVHEFVHGHFHWTHMMVRIKQKDVRFCRIAIAFLKRHKKSAHPTVDGDSFPTIREDVRMRFDVSRIRD